MKNKKNTNNNNKKNHKIRIRRTAKENEEVD